MLPSFLALAAIIGLIALGLGLTGRALARSPSLPRYWWLLGFAAVPQLLWSHWISHWSAGADAWTWLIPATYVPVLVFLLGNVRHAWARLVLIGAALNLLVIVLNGGTMPARAADSPAVAGSSIVAPTHLVPGTKDRASGPATIVPLERLADRYVIVLPGGAMRIASIGDVVVLAGALLALVGAVSVPGGPVREADTTPRRHLARMPEHG